jgi:hypothetical protein
LVFITAVTVAYVYLRGYIDSIVSLDSATICHLVRNISIIHRDLRQRILRLGSMVEWFILALVSAMVTTQLGSDDTILRIVEVVADSDISQHDWHAILKEVLSI